MTAEGKLVSLKKDDIEQRKEGKSAMPEDLTKHLSRRDLRDLVEFLSSLK
jgi:quinoprotein glucose dehydrogenase